MSNGYEGILPIISCLLFLLKAFGFYITWKAIWIPMIAFWIIEFILTIIEYGDWR